VPKLPRVPSSLVIHTLKRAGFYEYHQAGSHLHLRHNTKQGLRVTIPVGKTTLAPKTLKSIIAQAGLSVDEFIKLL